MTLTLDNNSKAEDNSPIVYKGVLFEIDRYIYKIYMS